MTILARQCGIEVELDDVPVASLVPDALADWAPKEGEVRQLDITPVSAGYHP